MVIFTGAKLHRVVPPCNIRNLVLYCIHWKLFHSIPYLSMKIYIHIICKNFPQQHYGYSSIPLDCTLASWPRRKWWLIVNPTSWEKNQTVDYNCNNNFVWPYLFVLVRKYTYFTIRCLQAAHRFLLPLYMYMCFVLYLHKHQIKILWQHHQNKICSSFKWPFRIK